VAEAERDALTRLAAFEHVRRLNEVLALTLLCPRSVNYTQRPLKIIYNATDWRSRTDRPSLLDGSTCACTSCYLVQGASTKSRIDELPRLFLSLQLRTYKLDLLN